MPRPTPTSWRSPDGRCFAAARSTPGPACSSRRSRSAKPPRSPSICPPPTRSLGCGRCSPGGSTGHVITLGVAGSSPARSDVPGGRWSGSPASERPTSCKAITVRRRTGCPRRRQSCETWSGGDRIRHVPPSLARVVGLRIPRSGDRSGHGCGDRADRPSSRQPLGRVHRRVAAGRARTRPGAPRRGASTSGGQPRTVDRPTAPVPAGPVVAGPRGTGEGGRGPRERVGAGP